MIELKENRLEFSFPEVHEHAKLTIEFQRTLRIPDDDSSYPLPPGFGTFPMVHVDDHNDTVPAKWLEHGGTILPMYQAEALWINFHSNYISDREAAYPFAVKVSTGKIDAITGKAHNNGLHQDPQDYLMVPKQPWLDGYCVKKGVIRQFVAMPLGEGYTVEEQITHEAEFGGIQIVVYPMKGKVFDKKFPKIEGFGSMRRAAKSLMAWAPPGGHIDHFASKSASKNMGLAPGGKMNQEIYSDDYKINDWHDEERSRCFVHLTNSLAWKEITGQKPPHMPPSANDYNNFGLPWFDYYDETAKAIEGSSTLDSLKSAQELSNEKDEAIGNQPLKAKSIVQLKSKRSKDQVREGDF